VTLEQEYFDRMYAADPDPWGLAERWYEQRKYALTVAALPRPRYRSGIEVGCSVGVLTALLGERCDRLLAIDVAAAAVEAARGRTAHLSGVRVEQRAMPAQWPGESSFDLVVLSEVGYYFELDELRRLIDQSCDALQPGGTLLAVHWRHPVADYPLPGDAVHAELDADERLAATVRHEERDFLLTVHARVPPEPRSVAEETGLA
jgi:SAM-dependent methyltransferase